MKIVRRLDRPVRCSTNVNCPAVFQLDDGRFAIIGADLTEELAELRPADASQGPNLCTVVVDRDTMRTAVLSLTTR